MTRSWNIVMTRILEHCDDKGLEYYDDTGMESRDEKGSRALQ